MRVKDVEFDVTYIDLRDKPDWFLAISPHGKVPVLSVEDTPLFESNAIAEFLDEVVSPALHPSDPVERARHRAWTDYVPTFSSGVSVYYAKTADEVESRLPTARKHLEKLEEAVTKDGRDGPFFGGEELCLVDAAYAPFLSRLLWIDETYLKTNLLDDFPAVKAWARALSDDARVKASVPENFEEEFKKGLKRRGSVVAPLLEAA